MVQGLFNPRPGFGIAVPGNEIPGWFNHQSKGSSISVQVRSRSMGFVACVAFCANGERPSVFCDFKANGRENYPSLMCIRCNSIQVLSANQIRETIIIKIRCYCSSPLKGPII